MRYGTSSLHGAPPSRLSWGRERKARTIGDEPSHFAAVAFKIANLSSAQLKASFGRATPESVEALSDALWKDTEAFIALAEMLADVRDRVEAARRNRI
jgi:hypothetical protein